MRQLTVVVGPRPWQNGQVVKSVRQLGTVKSAKLRVLRPRNATSEVVCITGSTALQRACRQQPIQVDQRVSALRERT